MKKFLSLLLVLLLLVPFAGCNQKEIKEVISLGEVVLEEVLNDNNQFSSSQNTQAPKKTHAPKQEEKIDYQGRYSDKDNVADYLFTYEKLPKNYITKNQAKKHGYIASKGNLWEVLDQMSIGGDVFSNREKKLPSKKGRTWYECDIDFEGGYRNAKRIVYSLDGLVYYTEDHYKTFTEIKDE